MRILINDVEIITHKGTIPHGSILVSDGVIEAVSDKVSTLTDVDVVYDAKGLYAAPGFIDIHVHGGGGVEFLNAEPEDIRKGCLAHLKHGTTTILPTASAAPLDMLLKTIDNVKTAKELTTECTIAGVHLEGPFLSPAQCGAQSSDVMLLPTEDVWNTLFDRWEGGVKIMGVAAELEGALELGEAMRSRGILGTISHSNANYKECVAALAHGYSDITHIYSGCSMVHRNNGYRSGGVVEAGLLEDGFTVQVIADGKHLPAELLRLIYKCKGPDQISLITDALFPTGCDLPEGTVVHQSTGVDAVLEDGVMKMPDRQAFAGSIATTDRLVKNMVKLADVPLWDAVTMVTKTPARVVGLDAHKGSIAAGYDADIVLLNSDLDVVKVIANGNFVTAE